MRLSQTNTVRTRTIVRPVERLVARPLALVAMLFSWAIGHTQILLPAPPPPPDARLAAPRDFTGYWVSLVTEDWRVRMMTPDKGDFAGIPLNAAGRALLATALFFYARRITITAPEGALSNIGPCVS